MVGHLSNIIEERASIIGAAAHRPSLKFQLHLLPRDDLDKPTSFLSFCPYTNIIAEGVTEDEATNAWIEKASSIFSFPIVLARSSFTTRKVVCGVVPSTSVPVFVIVDDQRKSHVLGPLEAARLGVSERPDRLQNSDNDGSSSTREADHDGEGGKGEESGNNGPENASGTKIGGDGGGDGEGKGKGNGDESTDRASDGLRSSIDDVGMFTDWKVSCTTIIDLPLLSSLQPLSFPSDSSSPSSSSSSSFSSCSFAPLAMPPLSGFSPSAPGPWGIPYLGLTPHYIN